MYARSPPALGISPASSARRARVVVALGALLWIGAVVAAVIEVGAHGPPQFVPFPATACPAPLIGVDSTLAYDADDQQRAATVAAIHTILHPRLVRDSLLWNEVEPVEGERDWSVPDGVVTDLRAAGIEPLLVVVGSPSWANGVPESKPGHDLYVPPRGPALDSWLQRYSKFLAAAVRRYHVVVKHWEIWNEPNLIDFWRPRPDPVVYGQVYYTLRATILSADPTASVAVGGLGDLTVAPAPSIPGLAFLRRLARTRAPISNVAIHPYTSLAHPPDVRVSGENNFQDIERIHELLVSLREPALIWVTEWGWPSASVGRQAQARYLGRSLAMLENRYPFVSIATYFTDHDLPMFSQGLLDRNLTAKPAASVFRFYAQRLAVRCRQLRSRP